MRASMRPGSSAAVRASSASHGSHAHVRAIAFDERIAHAAIAARARCGCQRRLQQQVVEHEREVERGIAVPRAFGVEDHRAVRPDQDVLGT